MKPLDYEEYFIHWGDKIPLNEYFKEHEEERKKYLRIWRALGKDCLAYLLSNDFKVMYVDNNSYETWARFYKETDYKLFGRQIYFSITASCNLKGRSAPRNSLWFTYSVCSRVCVTEESYLGDYCYWEKGFKEEAQEIQNKIEDIFCRLAAYAEITKSSSWWEYKINGCTPA